MNLLFIMSIVFVILMAISCTIAFVLLFKDIKQEKALNISDETLEEIIRIKELLNDKNKS